MFITSSAAQNVSGECFESHLEKGGEEMSEIKKIIIENVKVINKQVEYAQKYIKEHSKEVSNISFEPQGFEKGCVKIEIIFDAPSLMLKEAQERIQMQK